MSGPRFHLNVLALCLCLQLGAGFAAAPAAFGQAFDCVLLPDDNTNVFVDAPQIPDCSLPENLDWCNCVRSLFSNPVKNEKSGFNQALLWVGGEPGIANQRIEVAGGTLDVSSLQPDQVIGETEVNELIPKSVSPIIGGQFFTVRSDVIVRTVNAGSVDFEIKVREVSQAAKLVLRYDPLDAAHQEGKFYFGRLTSNGPGNGFVLEYRYPTELIDEAADPKHYPAVQPNDADAPGFTVRFIIRYFTAESGIFTLPNDGQAAVTTVLRKFTVSTLSDVLPLGESDLCQAATDPNPCKEIEETLQIKNSAGENSPPVARIIMTDPVSAALISDPALVSLQCNEARILFRGAESDDGDGGTQALSYEWAVAEGPDGGAVIPAETQHFKDSEITFRAIGIYKIKLQVNDGQSANNLAETIVTVNVDDAFNVNASPSADIVTIPDPPTAELQDGLATLTLDGSASSNGAPGSDDCAQVLAFQWRELSSPRPGGLTLVSPTGAVTEARFTFPGDYLIELEVDDGQLEDNLDAAEVAVVITGSAGGIQKPGDCNQDGDTDISDAICLLGHLFLGEPAALPCDAGRDNDPGNLSLLNYNGDGQTDITDSINLLQRLFLGGDPHVLGESCTPISGCPATECKS